MKTNIVIDVEMCGVKQRKSCYSCRNEIIQIGAVMLDETYEIVDKFSTYVKPRYGRIDNYIFKLTGISDKSIKDAPDIEDALTHMLEWIGSNDAVFYSWSTTDFFQIRNEIRTKCQDSSKLDSLLDIGNWVDYQQKLGKRLCAEHLIKLSDALLLAEVDTQGRMHNGLDDAYNTALMIAKLEVQKNYMTLIEKYRAREAEQKPLSVSLGDLMKGITLATA